MDIVVITTKDYLECLCFCSNILLLLYRFNHTNTYHYTSIISVDIFGSLVITIIELIYVTTFIVHYNTDYENTSQIIINFGGHLS